MISAMKYFIENTDDLVLILAGVPGTWAAILKFGEKWKTWTTITQNVKKQFKQTHCETLYFNAVNYYTNRWSKSPFWLVGGTFLVMHDFAGHIVSMANFEISEKSWNLKYEQLIACLDSPYVHFQVF